MNFEIKDGLLFLDGKQVPFINTPNKRGTMMPSFLIIHFTADNNPASTINWFKNPVAQASAHILIDREGKVTQFGKFTEILWHAGKSEWKGIVGLNSHSIGVELTNLGATANKPGSVFLKHKNEANPRYWQTYPDKQIDVLKAVSDCLVATYKLKDIIGHDDISPIRKSDPGPAFPWNRIKADKTTYITSTDVNLRSGPSTSTEVIKILKKGSSVLVVGEEGDFKKVVTDCKTIGFVAQKYLI